MSDDWDFYFLQVDGRPASIFVDLGVAKIAPIRMHATMAYLRVRMRRPREDGLSSQEEFEDLVALEDAATATLTENGKAIYVGRNTSDGNRDLYYYVSDSVKFERNARSLMQRFPGYPYVTGSRPDPDWKTYFQFLRPSPIDMRRIMNRRVCDVLEERGDNPALKRTIDHFAVFPDADARSIFIEHLRAERFCIGDVADEPNYKGRFGVEFASVLIDKSFTQSHYFDNTSRDADRRDEDGESKAQINNRFG